MDGLEPKVRGDCGIGVCTTPHPDPQDLERILGSIRGRELTPFDLIRRHVVSLPNLLFVSLAG